MIGLQLVASLLLAPGAGAQPQWQLVEDLRIGGEQSDATIFTDVRGVVAGPRGHILVLDARPQEIRVFDATGKFLTTAARRGQGPGEIANANGMLLVGDTLWVNDPSNGRWSAWSAIDGRYLRQITIAVTGYGFIWEAGLDAAGRIADPISLASDRRGADGRPMYERHLRLVTTGGRIADTVPFTGCTQRNPPPRTFFRGSGIGPNGPGNTNRSIPFLPQPLSAMDQKGGYWCSPNDEYVLVHRAFGRNDTLHAVRMPYSRLAVARAQRDSAIEEMRTALSRYTVNDADYSLVPSTQPVFARLDVDDRGQLWARRTVAAGSPIRFDVYDANGRSIASVATTLRFARYIPLHFRGDHVYGVALGEDDVPYVVRARIVPAP